MLGISSANRFWRKLKGLWNRTDGSTGIFLGFAIIPMIAAIGLAVDASLGYILKSRLSKSLDAAGLAAGRAAASDQAELDAQNFFEANFDEGMLGSQLIDFSFNMDTAQEFITLTARAQMPTTFMRIFGHEFMTVSARTVIQRQTKGMELVLVMDNTGSMLAGNKIGAMKSAARNLIDILYGNNETVDNLFVALVPYTATVNVGNNRVGWLDPTDRVHGGGNPFQPSNWKGCVEAQNYPFDTDDTPPGQRPLKSFFYVSEINNNWPPLSENHNAGNNGRGPNLGCGPAITSLIESKSDIQAAIDNMQAWHRGGTTGNLGLSWGWRALSPRWRGLWGGDTPSDLPLDYDNDNMEKVVILLTDGQNQFHNQNNNNPRGSDYTAYGHLHTFGYASLNAARQELDRRMTETCNAMKDEGIILYTITFGPTPDAATQNLYEDCATAPGNYFHAPSNSDLATAFQAIGGQLSNLRIAE